MATNKWVRKHMSNLGKLSHKKKPRTKEFYQEMARKRWKKLSTDDACSKQEDVI